MVLEFLCERKFFSRAQYIFYGHEVVVILIGFVVTSVCVGNSATSNDGRLVWQILHSRILLALQHIPPSWNPPSLACSSLLDHILECLPWRGKYSRLICFG